jgi:hypothetical protein
MGEDMSGSEAHHVSGPEGSPGAFGHMGLGDLLDDGLTHLCTFFFSRSSV